ncbi:sodium-coupled monocarboxylate transporter 1 isoform X1 [Macaca nemestrina]|uniref:Sodium-coupled monocarboxylate transporter 1 n=2 Tax=Macaca TaxID=9539 RepID=G7PJA6_MACFA|nr:sodium-coupled monocarboxylate transporter 1 [Macaca fascicularis]XP_011760079.1 sodium-coupled monocarboxylate transporter 1 [Macaca nemestrina]XP_050602768.1 sodium-coupled monocarboxylate transporter 1 [Macaca thibetana thibetana]EHH66626.1 Electrogenic sodium monocarboxylate cotransporter [Macaca fascicularis]
MDMPRGIGTFVVWDYVVFAGMLVISAAIGIYYAFAGGGQQTSKDFLMGGRRMTAVPVALSLTASFMSAVTVLGTPSEVYRFGAIFSIFAFTYFFVVVISAEVFLPVFYKLGITSTYEYLELRFNKCVRLCGTVLFIVQTILYTGIVIYAPALALNQVTGFDLWGAVVATGVVCTFYCTLGGLKAVIWTDVFQVGIMVAGFASVIIQAAVIQGGISTILNDAYNGGRLNFWNFNPNPLQRHTFWTIIIGGTFTWSSIYGVNQSQVQRYISCKSRFQAKLSLYINLVGLWAILTCSVFCGLALYSRYRDCDPWTAKKVSAPDQLMPYLVLDILQDYPGLPGLFVACAYSGTLSTVSSSINALAAVTVEDLIKPYFRSLSERSLSWISQGMSVVYGALCIGMAALASLMGALLQAALSIFGMVGGPLMGLFALGILVPFANSIGALVGLMAGFATSLWVGIGAQMYPPLPERTLPLQLDIQGCNSTYNETNLMTTTEMPFTTSVFQIHNVQRTPLMDNWYSLSYLYFSTVGTLVTLLVGILVSLPTGGRKQNLDPRYILTKEDFLSNFDIFKKKKHVLNYKSHPVEDGGTDNPAFNHIELNFSDQSGKSNGTRL